MGHGGNLGYTVTQSYYYYSGSSISGTRNELGWI
jgi:hypothetical protein